MKEAKFVFDKGLAYRDVRKSDVQLLFEVIYSNPYITMPNAYMPHEKLIETKLHLRKVRLRTRFKDYVYKLVFDGQTFVGVICLRRMSPVSAEVSYNVNQEYWNRGYGTSMLNTALMFAEELGYNFVCARIMYNNKGSLRICEKNGFKFDRVDGEYLAVKKIEGGSRYGVRSDDCI